MRTLSIDQITFNDLEENSLEKRERSLSSILYLEALKKGILKEPILK